jgi:tetratricopeptide (TPR) repeat protein
MRQTVVRYEKLDHFELAPDLLKQRAFTGALLAECSHPGQVGQLCEIAGAVSGVLGYLAVGRADFSLARAYTLEAFQLAGYAEDAGLQAWARGLQSFCEYYAGRYEEALSLAEDGLSYAQTGPQSVRLTINGAARAMGKLRDTEGVHRSVEQAYDLMSRNDVPEGVPSSISFECYSAAQTASNAATAYVSLGAADKVQHYVDLALPDISRSGSPWSRSLVTIDLALSLIRSKDADLDRAAQLVLDALSISAGRPVISVKQRTSEFIWTAADRWGNVAIQQASAA